MRARIVAGLVPAAYLLVAVCLLAWYLTGQQADSRGDAATARAQRALSGQVPEATATGTRLHPRPTPTATPAAVGHALATMRIPRFGADWRWTALEGTADSVIANGPGHYEGTALPGEKGNAAFAGHRAGHGDPFIDFDLLRPGDRVYLSQGRTTWTYRLTTAPQIIEVTDVWVLDPLPGRQLTLTTCWPKYGSAKRMFVRGTLVDVTVAPTAG